MNDETPIVQALHACYMQRSGLEIPLTMGRIMAWNQWRSHGFTEGDLEAVIALTKRRIAEKRKWEGSLHFSKLIENISHFEEMLAEARAWRRAPVVDKARAQVLQATGRPAPVVEVKTVAAGDVLATAEAFAKFKQWRVENNL